VKREEGRVKGPEEQPKRDLPQRTFEFACRIVKLCQALDQKPGVSRTLAGQLLRSGTSIGANVEEGQGSQSRADFVAKYYVACKEARETHYWLRLLAACEIVPRKRLEALIDEANQIVAILTTITKTARANTPERRRVKRNG
jgi:four helix bundle protein